MIGADREAIHRGEDRQVFKDLMIKIGLKVPRSGVVHNMDEARKVLDDIGLPLIIRPAFTLGGTGGGIAYNVEEFEDDRPARPRRLAGHRGADRAVGHRLEGIRDGGDARQERQRRHHLLDRKHRRRWASTPATRITVAPIQTLTDKEYQRMRDAAIAVIRAVGVETGGSQHPVRASTPTTARWSSSR